MIKSLSSRELIQMLKADGWELVGTDGDHWQFRHPTKRGKVTVAHPLRDIPPGTLRNVYRQAGWDWKDRR